MALRPPFNNHINPMTTKPSSKKTYQFGILAEKITMFYLRLTGYKILAWRYKSYFGEIDIIARKSNVIIIIEVKARRKKTLVEEVLRPKQIQRIKKSADSFIARNRKYHNYYMRFDFIEVGRFFLLKHHRNFF